MAITCTYKTSEGFEIKNCYVKVESYTGDKTRTVIEVQFRTFQHGNVIYGRQFVFTPDLESTKNILAQAYDYLKSLPEFTEVVDS